ncbi:MAG: hypothetical protein OXI49_07445 [Acidobacteriota bacterium]|nr:hypothetical protein [Acidobacteriota bacterium]
MNWGRAIGAGLAAGFVQNIANFVMHGLVLGGMYLDQPAFVQEPDNMAMQIVWFLVIALVLGVVASLLFASSRQSWQPGAKGGLHFGVLLGAVVGFQQFYLTLVVNDFPYHVAWLWLAVDVISFGIGGIVLGAVYKRAE